MNATQPITGRPICSKIAYAIRCDPLWVASSRLLLHQHRVEVPGQPRPAVAMELHLLCREGFRWPCDL
jgi:hypothetical protein